jgi:hypothetical protein
MPETLTESFCERCGTRYEFKAPTRLNPLRKTRGFVSGLRNYIMSQDALSDAIGDAMRSEEEMLAARQLESFHESFNFCIDCRQYTCNSCWNEGAGRCRTCIPVAGTDDLIERFEASFAGTQESPEVQPVGAEAWPSADLRDGQRVLDWGTTDLREESQAFAEPEPEPTLAVEPGPEPEPTLAVEPELEPEPTLAIEPELEPEPTLAIEPEPEPGVLAWDGEQPEPVVAEQPEPEPVVAEQPEPEPVVLPWDAEQPEPEPVVAEQPEPEPVVLAWDADTEFELVAEQPSELVESREDPAIRFAEAPIFGIEEEVLPPPSVSPAALTEADVVADSEAFEQVAEAPSLPIEEREPEPTLAAEPELEPEPVVAAEPEREPEPTLAAEPEPVVAEPARPVVSFPRGPSADTPSLDEERIAAAAEDPALAARRAQLDSLGLGDASRGTHPVEGTVLPYRSSGAGVHPVEAARLGQQAATAAQTMRASMWAASSREVVGAVSAIGIQSCGECGLSLSASARFCRRCGTRQARSA